MELYSFKIRPRLLLKQDSIRSFELLGSNLANPFIERRAGRIQSNDTLAKIEFIAIVSDDERDGRLSEDISAMEEADFR
jgi:hypothetical protein